MFSDDEGVQKGNIDLKWVKKKHSTSQQKPFQNQQERRNEYR